MPQPEGKHDEADESGDAGPVDIGFFQITDGLHQEKPGQDDDRQDDDESDHATPRSMRLHLNGNMGSLPTIFSIPAKAGPQGPLATPKRSFVFTDARNVLPERRALVAQLVEQRFCNSLDQSATALKSLNVFQSEVSGVYVRVNVPP